MRAGVRVAAGKVLAQRALGASVWGGAGARKNPAACLAAGLTSPTRTRT